MIITFASLFGHIRRDPVYIPSVSRGQVTLIPKENHYKMPFALRMCARSYFSLAPVLPNNGCRSERGVVPFAADGTLSTFAHACIEAPSHYIRRVIT